MYIYIYINVLFLRYIKVISVSHVKCICHVYKMYLYMLYLCLI